MHKNSKIRSLKFKISLIFPAMAVFLLSHMGFCDILRLKEVPKDKDGNEVEILEEKEDSFIVKVPKDEIKVIKRKRPTEIKAWREKRIMWEDAGDYITLYLPKEKIILPENYKGDEYDSAKVLREELKYSGTEGRPESTAFWKGSGKITGRILKNGQPLAKARARIVYVSSSVDTFSKIFGPEEGKPQDRSLEVVADEAGQYEFRNVPIGEYDIYWSAPGADSWYRRLSDKPNIIVRPGETVSYPDIEVK